MFNCNKVVILVLLRLNLLYLFIRQLSRWLFKSKCYIISRYQYKRNYHIPHEVAALFYDISFYDTNGVDSETWRLERKNNYLVRWTWALVDIYHYKRLQTNYNTLLHYNTLESKHHLNAREKVHTNGRETTDSSISHLWNLIIIFHMFLYVNLSSFMMKLGLTWKPILFPICVLKETGYYWKSHSPSQWESIKY